MPELSASEALFGFIGWLTTRDKSVTLSAHHNAGIAVNLVSHFCKVNNLIEPKEHWEEQFIMPSNTWPEE